MAYKEYASHKEKGLCVSCGRPAAKGYTLCLLCLDKKRRWAREYYKDIAIRVRQNLYRKNRYYKLKLENRCIDCKMPLNEESCAGIYCVNCRNRNNKTGY